MSQERSIVIPCDFEDSIAEFDILVDLSFDETTREYTFVRAEEDKDFGGEGEWDTWEAFTEETGWTWSWIETFISKQIGW